MLSDDAQLTTCDNRRQPAAIGHLSGPGVLNSKKIKSLDGIR